MNQQHDEIEDTQVDFGNIGLIETGLMAAGAVCITMQYYSIGAILFIAALGRLAWRWHKSSIVDFADHAIEDTARTYQSVRELPKTTQRLAAHVKQKTATGQSNKPQTTTNDDLFTLLTEKHHILFIGHTRGGKTTLMHALARHIAQESNVLFLDPDAIRGKYPGYKVVGAGDDYASIAQALDRVQVEIAGRRKARANGQRTFEPFWIFADEVHDILGEIDGALNIFRDIIKRGAKLGMHIGMGTQDAQVKTLGLEGQSQLLKNLTLIDLRYTNKQRTATVDKITTYTVPNLPLVDDTVVVTKATSHDEDLLQSLLFTTPTTSLEKRIANTTHHPTTTAWGNTQGTRNSDDKEKQKIIATAHAVIAERGKLSRSEVCRRVFGATGGAMYNKIKTVLDEAEL